MESPPPSLPDSKPPLLTPSVPLAGTVPNEGLLRAQRGGGSWFFWIAGLSLVNSIAMHSGANISFVVGLGVTQIADVVLHSIGTFGHVLAYFVDLVILGMFVLFGYFARNGKLWAFITGFVLYALDAVIYAVLPDTPEWLPIGFHAFVLFSIWGGLQAARKLKRAATPPAV